SSSLVGATTIPEGGIAYTVAPDSLVVVVRTPSRASRSSKSRASRPPSSGETSSTREVQRAYQDCGEVTGSSPPLRAELRDPPTVGYAGAGLSRGNAGMPSLRGRPPHIDQRRPSSRRYRSNHGWSMAP